MSAEETKAIVLEAFDTLFNRRDYAKAAKFWSETYIQHSAHIPPGRDGLFSLVRSLPDIRGHHTLFDEVAHGQCVEIILEGRGLEIEEEKHSLVWRGTPCSCQFRVTAPEHAGSQTFHPRVLVLVNSVPVGSVSFVLRERICQSFASPLAAFNRYVSEWVAIYKSQRVRVRCRRPQSF